MNQTALIQQESSRCLLCLDPPCSAFCPEHIDCAAILFSARFKNFAGAAAKAKSAPCAGCKDRACEKSCVRAKTGLGAVRVADAIAAARNLSDDSVLLRYGAACDGAELSGLSLDCDFMGVRCENPFFISSSVAASDYEMISRAFKAGWAGAAFKTISYLVPQEASPRYSALQNEARSFIGFKNIEQLSDRTPKENFDAIRRLKKDFPAKVVIASVMGQNEDEWAALAKASEEAGADIIECNFSCPNMTKRGTGSDMGQDPGAVEKFCRAARRATRLPILAKMTPNVARMEEPAGAAIRGGADGISAINTIKSIMNVDLESFSTSPDVAGFSCEGGYSGKAVKPIALRFINEMRQNRYLRNIPISGMGGIESWQDAAEFIALGCGTVQVTTAVMEYGQRIVGDMIDGMKRYLKKRGFKSVLDFVGSAVPKIVRAEALDRASKSWPRFDRDLCAGCGRCVISCADGGHQALRFGEAADGNGDARVSEKTAEGGRNARRPILIGANCAGCHLCVLACPAGAIGPGNRSGAR